MKVLVTGANGGLGRLLITRLAAEGRDELFLTGRAAAGLRNYVACDITDPRAVAQLVRNIQPDRVFHLAGSFSGDYERDRAINADGALHVCEAVRLMPFRTRIIVIGSAAEYGAVSPEENPVSENRVLRPVSIYGLTKALQTHIASFYANHFSMDIVVARLFNLLTTGLSDRLFVGRAERLIQRFKRGEIATMEFGNLSSTRDYVEGEAAVDQLLRIADKGERGDVYNVASGIPIEMRVLLLRLLQDAGLDQSAVREAPDLSVRTGYDAPSIYADTSKTRGLADA